MTARAAVSHIAASASNGQTRRSSTELFSAWLHSLQHAVWGWRGYVWRHWPCSSPVARTRGRKKRWGGRGGVRVRLWWRGSRSCWRECEESGRGRRVKIQQRERRRECVRCGGEGGGGGCRWRRYWLYTGARPSCCSFDLTTRLAGFSSFGSQSGHGFRVRERSEPWLQFLSCPFEAPSYQPRLSPRSATSSPFVPPHVPRPFRHSFPHHPLSSL